MKKRSAQFTTNVGRLRVLIKERDLTYIDLAEMIGTTRSKISRRLNYITPISRKDAKQLVSALGLSEEEIIQVFGETL